MNGRAEKLRSGLGAGAMVGALAVLAPEAALTEACDPGFAKLRFEDDLSCYREASSSDHPLDPLKWIEVDEAGDVALSIGGEIRERYEFTNNPLFGEDMQDERGVWLQRLTLHGDLRFGPHARVFAQLLSGIAVGRAEGPSPVDENRLAVQNAFIEFEKSFMESEALGARVGRQEIVFGSGRLVDVREGPNVRRTFDAARGWIEFGDWRIDGLAARPRDLERGVFDDDADQDKGLWGVYATGEPDWLPAGSIDVYYLGFSDEDGVFAQGSEDEVRHSVGVRVHGAENGWDWNWEGVYQFGSFGDGEIRAWTIGTETGFTFESLPWRPRLALSANIASGDDDGEDADLETFNPLFPRGNYFSEAAVLGPRNFYNLHGFLTVTPHDQLSFTTDVNFFWRLSRDDGVYSPSGQIIRPAGGPGSFVGSALSISAEYQATARLGLTAIYTRFFTGEVINASGPSKDIDFIELTAQFKF